MFAPYLPKDFWFNVKTFKFDLFISLLYLSELLEKTCQIANVLKRKGVKKGDTVCIYMPVSPIAVACMLACTRIGAVHR